MFIQQNLAASLIVEDAIAKVSVGNLAFTIDVVSNLWGIVALDVLVGVVGDDGVDGLADWAVLGNRHRLDVGLLLVELSVVRVLDQGPLMVHWGSMVVVSVHSVVVVLGIVILFLVLTLVPVVDRDGGVSNNWNLMSDSGDNWDGMGNSSVVSKIVVILFTLVVLFALVLTLIPVVGRDGGVVGRDGSVVNWGGMVGGVIVVVLL